ncbi:MAG TPA: hypothetical protein VER17_20620 [Tepidisphaeraceae bacterium]|nr:hypothetical protein [Tepidisphaeraceae bacterium]
MKESFVLEALEPRRLCAADAAVVPVAWDGEATMMRRGEWIVALTAGESALTGPYTRSTSPSPELGAALGPVGAIGVRFTRYLGSQNVFLIEVPDAVGHQQLHNAFGALPGFTSVEPNVVGNFGTTPANGTWPEVSTPLPDSGTGTWPEVSTPLPDSGTGTWPEVSTPLPHESDSPLTSRLNSDGWPEISHVIEVDRGWPEISALLDDPPVGEDWVLGGDSDSPTNGN